MIGANLSNADLIGADLSEANLSGADLSGARMMIANLQQANLCEATLMRANLSDSNLLQCQLVGAKLNRAYLRCANLEKAELYSDSKLSITKKRFTDLSGANLLRANLREANLKGAVLKRTYLAHACLDRTDLSDADLNGADLSRVNLSTAKLLETRLRVNLDLSPTEKTWLYEQGASVMPLNPLWDESSSKQKNWFEVIRPIDEVRGDLNYCFLDLEEVLHIFREAIKILKSEVEEQQHLHKIRESNLIFKVIPMLEADCTRFTQQIEADKERISHLFDNTSSKELSQWIAREFPLEIDNIHVQILKLAEFSKLVHVVWINLLESDP